MMRRQQFELEALEPRVLLSADPALAALAAGPAQDPLPAFEAVAVEESLNSPLSILNFAALAYDPAEQIDDIFAGTEGQEIATVAAPSSVPIRDARAEESASFESAGMETHAQDAKSGRWRDAMISSSASCGIGNSSPDHPNPSVEQITETLRVANAPPVGLWASQPGVVSSATCPIDACGFCTVPGTVGWVEQFGPIPCVGFSSQPLDSTAAFPSEISSFRPVSEHQFEVNTVTAIDSSAEVLSCLALREGFDDSTCVKSASHNQVAGGHLSTSSGMPEAPSHGGGGAEESTDQTRIGGAL